MSSVVVSFQDHVALVEMARPEKMNAQNLEMRQELVAAFSELSDRHDVRCVVLTGRGKAFSVGHDLVEQLSPEENQADPGGVGLYSSLFSVAQPVVAAINGLCLAQGAGLALLCDIRIADRSSELGWPQVSHGIASVSGPVIMARLAPQAIASELLFTDKRIGADAAFAHGLLTRVVDDGDCLEQALEVAGTISSMAPLAVRAVKEIMVRTRSMPLADAFHAGERMARLLNSSEDAHEGHLAFAEGREPVWKGR